MNLELVGKTALITGGSRGIGLAVARSLAAEGCALHLASRTGKDLESAQREISQAHGVGVSIHVADLSDDAAAAKLVAACSEVDILVNNAGAVPSGTLAAVDNETWKRSWDLKVFGYLSLMRGLLPSMQRRGQGVIINIIGTGGEKPTADYLVGGGANASLIAMTRALGSASVDQGVRVLGVNPGIVKTDRTAEALRLHPEICERLPFKRPAWPEEIADVVCFLASARASYISGTIVTIDGGTVGRGSTF